MTKEKVKETSILKKQDKFQFLQFRVIHPIQWVIFLQLGCRNYSFFISLLSISIIPSFSSKIKITVYILIYYTTEAWTSILENESTSLVTVSKMNRITNYSCYNLVGKYKQFIYLYKINIVNVILLMQKLNAQPWVSKSINLIERKRSSTIHFSLRENPQYCGTQIFDHLPIYHLFL